MRYHSCRGRMVAAQASLSWVFFCLSMEHLRYVVMPQPPTALKLAPVGQCGCDQDWLPPFSVISNCY